MNAIMAYNIDDECPSQPFHATVHVASLIVHVKRERKSRIVEWLEQQPRVEIHRQSPEGKLAVVMECDHEQAVLDLLNTLNDMPGVLNAVLIYHEVIDGEEYA